MADLDRIKRNVTKMAEQGAPESDIDGYIASEGVTLDQIRDHKRGNWLTRTVGDAITGTVDMVRGKQDPAFANTPTIMEANNVSPDVRDRILQGNAAARTLTVSDDAYADVVQSQLGDAFVGRETDANGYPVLVYRDKDGKEARAYVNRPGLDFDDIDRGMFAALPFIAGGNVVGAATKGLGALSRIGAQGATGASVSVAQDAAASGIGSEQGIDPTKAVIAGGFGAFGEAASPLLQMGKNALGFGTKYVDDAGNFTREGNRAARQAGVSPKDIEPELRQAFAEALRVGRDPKEALSSVRSNQFGIPTTKGQRTKDPELLSIEKDIRYGNLGEDAKSALQKLDTEQKQAITNQVRGNVASVGDGIDEFRGIGAEIAPARLPHEQNAQTMGQSIRGGVTEARDALKSQERAAWDAVPDMTASPKAFEDLPAALENQLGRMRLDSQLTPTAMRMDADIAAFRDGKSIVPDGPQMIKQTPIRTLDEMRRRLLETYKTAAPGSPDAKAAKAYYDGFNDWMWDAAEKGTLNVSAEEVAKLNAAREITREVKGLFQPRSADGQKLPANRILSQVMEETNTPEGVIAALLGSSGPQTVPKGGVVDALQRIRAILNKAGANNAGGMTAKDTWNDIRMAYWLRLTTGNDGATLSPTMLKKNIEQAFHNQKSVLDILFSAEEKKQFHAFAKAVGEAAYKDPNPSGTASALRAMVNGPKTSLVKTALQTQSKRELFSKHNVLMSRIYSMLAQRVPNLAGGRDAIGLRAAKRSVDQRLTPRRPPTAAGASSAIGSQTGSE